MSRFTGLSERDEMSRFTGLSERNLRYTQWLELIPKPQDYRRNSAYIHY